MKNKFSNSKANIITAVICAVTLVLIGITVVFFGYKMNWFVKDKVDNIETIPVSENTYSECKISDDGVVIDDVAYICDSDGLRIFDLKSKKKTTICKDEYGYIQSFGCNGEYVCFACLRNYDDDSMILDAIYMYNIETGNTEKVMSFVDMEKYYCKIEFFDSNYVYISYYADSKDELCKIDISKKECTTVCKDLLSCEYSQGYLSYIEGSGSSSDYSFGTLKIMNTETYEVNEFTGNVTAFEDCTVYILKDKVYYLESGDYTTSRSKSHLCCSNIDSSNKIVMTTDNETWNITSSEVALFSTNFGEERRVFWLNLKTGKGGCFDEDIFYNMSDIAVIDDKIIIKEIDSDIYREISINNDGTVKDLVKCKLNEDNSNDKCTYVASSGKIVCYYTDDTYEHISSKLISNTLSTDNTTKGVEK